jgi:hypothetical protein
MWLDCFGAGKVYHGGEYRLAFHHQHNAMSVMNTAGALRWIEHMEIVLDAACAEGGTLARHCNNDAEATRRVRLAINSFLGYFMDDYAEKFDFTGYKGHASRAGKSHVLPFGARNPAIGVNGKVLNAAAASSSSSSSSSVSASTAAPAINLLAMTDKQIREELSVQELKCALIRHKIDISKCLEKKDLVDLALRLIS